MKKYGGERGRSKAMFGYKMELTDAVCERFQSTEILRHAERILGECSFKAGGQVPESVPSLWKRWQLLVSRFD